jgi:hypothetical protein
MAMATLVATFDWLWLHWWQRLIGYGYTGGNVETLGPHLLCERCCWVVRQRLRLVLPANGCELCLDEQAGAGDAVHLQVQQDAKRTDKLGVCCYLILVAKSVMRTKN